MKKFLYLLPMMVLVSCSNNEPSATQQVTFLVDGLQVSTSESLNAPSRKGDTPSAAGLTDLWLFEGTTLLDHQVSTDADFGSPSVELTTGEHTITFVGSGKKGQAVTNGVWSADKISDTYGYALALTVTSGMSTQQVTLARANYSIQWTSTDVVPNDAKDIEIVINPHRSTLVAGLAGGESSEYTFTADIVGKLGETMTASISGFCAVLGTEENVTTTFRLKDINGTVLVEHSKEVPVLSNRKTIITGALFDNRTPASVSVNQEWLTAHEVDL